MSAASMAGHTPRTHASQGATRTADRRLTRLFSLLVAWSSCDEATRVRFESAERSAASFVDATHARTIENKRSQREESGYGSVRQAGYGGVTKPGTGRVRDGTNSGMERVQELTVLGTSRLRKLTAPAISRVRKLIGLGTSRVWVRR